MKKIKIPFNKPFYEKKSIQDVQSSLHSGNTSGKGPYTKNCEEFLLKENNNVSGVYLSTSCTHALEAAAIMLDLSGDDEVIVPSYTYTTSALAFFMKGAKIRFCDIRDDTLNIDDRLLESQINKNTKAIVVVHYAGVGCEMDEIMKIAHKYNLSVIEDNAHGLFGKYKNINLGCFGNFSTLSFHETKNFSCGEGGALFVRDKKDLKNADIIFEKGTNRSQFINGSVDKYSWVGKGSSYVLSDILAALLLNQFKNSKIIQSKRKKLWDNYFESLLSWSTENNVGLPFKPEYCEQTYHMFYLIFSKKRIRDSFINHLKSAGVSAVFHYIPLDSSKMGKKIQLKDQQKCPVSKSISERIVRLPLYCDLSYSDQSKIINLIKNFKSTNI